MSIRNIGGVSGSTFRAIALMNNVANKERRKTFHHEIAQKIVSRFIAAL